MMSNLFTESLLTARFLSDEPYSTEEVKLYHNIWQAIGEAKRSNIAATLAEYGADAPLNLPTPEEGSTLHWDFYTIWRNRWGEEALLQPLAAQLGRGRLKKVIREDLKHVSDGNLLKVFFTNLLNLQGHEYLNYFECILTSTKSHLLTYQAINVVRTLQESNVQILKGMMTAYYNHTGLILPVWGEEDFSGLPHEVSQELVQHALTLSKKQVTPSKLPPSTKRLLERFLGYTWRSDYMFNGNWLAAVSLDTTEQVIPVLTRLVEYKAFDDASTINLVKTNPYVLPVVGSLTRQQDYEGLGLLALFLGTEAVFTEMVQHGATSEDLVAVYEEGGVPEFNLMHSVPESVLRKLPAELLYDAVHFGGQQSALNFLHIMTEGNLSAEAGYALLELIETPVNDRTVDELLALVKSV